MPSWKTLDVAEWLPDLGSFNNPGATIALNVIPGRVSYRPMPSKQAFTQATPTATSDRIRGACAVKSNANVTYVIAGDASDLYQLSATGWDSVGSAGSGDYSGTATDERWTFSQWGEKLVANNYNNKPQVMTLGTPPFAALGGSPPRARYSGVVRDFLVLAYINTGTVFPNRVHWSAYNDISSANAWTPNLATQCDLQDLPEGGWITGFVGGNYGVIIQEKTIQVMSYAGPPPIFRFDRVKKSQGSLVPGSIVGHNNWVFYLGSDDFYMFNGQETTGLGIEKFARTFFADYDASLAARVYSAIDPDNTLVFWLYPGAGNVGGRPNRLLVYNWTVGRGAVVECEADVVFAYASAGYTMDGLDAISGNLDTLTADLDADTWKGGVPTLAVFDANYKLAPFDGTAMEGVIETAEAEVAPGRVASIYNMRALIEGGSATLSLGTRAGLSDPVVYTQAAAANAFGEHNIRKTARYVRVRLDCKGAWDHAKGAQIYIRAGGSR